MNSLFSKCVFLSITRVSPRVLVNFNPIRLKSKSAETLETTADSQKKLRKIQKIFNCDVQLTKKEIQAFLNSTDFKAVVSSLKYLTKIGATLPTIIDNIDLVKVKKDELEKRFKLLAKSPYWKQNIDFIPFLIQPKSKLNLQNVKKLTERVYFLSEKLEVDPHVVSKYMAKHLFSWNMSLELYERKINLIHRHAGIQSINILRDLNILLRDENVLIEKFDFIKRHGKCLQKKMPWMAKCKESVVKRTIDIRSTLHPFKVYVTEVKKWDKKCVNRAFFMLPELHRIPLEQIRNIHELLDKYFGCETISKHPNVFLIPFERITERLNEIEKLQLPLPYDKKILRSLCRVERGFAKFLQSMKDETKSK